MKKYVIIVAGGAGKRMNSVVPKQFLLLAGKPVLMHTIEKFYCYNNDIQIIAVLPNEQIDFWKTLCKKHKFTIPHKFTAGGASRFHSVKNGLNLVKTPSLVAVHDGVRPLVSVETIIRSFDAAEKFDAAIPVVSPVDSLRQVSDNKNSLPPVGCGIMFHYPDEYYFYPDYLQRAKSHLKYANQDFKVRIGGGLFYLNSWDILNDTVDFYNVHADAVVSCDLQDIYEYICRVEKFEDNTKRTPEGAMKLEFEPEDLYPENLLNSAGDRFLLIKSGETYTDTYNLVAFQIVEGCYTFFIAQEDIKDYVLYTETIFTDKDWTINEKGEITVKNIEQKLELPPVVGEYQLYSGGFNTNKVTVCFGEK